MQTGSGPPPPQQPYYPPGQGPYPPGPGQMPPPGQGYPPGPGQPYGQPYTGQQGPYMGQPAVGVVMAPAAMPQCSNCGAMDGSEYEYYIGTQAWILCIILSFFFIFGCCPLCCQACQDRRVVCRRCKVPYVPLYRAPMAAPIMMGPGPMGPGPMGPGPMMPPPVQPYPNQPGPYQQPPMQTNQPPAYAS